MTTAIVTGLYLPSDTFYNVEDAEDAKRKWFDRYHRAHGFRAAILKVELESENAG